MSGTRRAFAAVLLVCGVQCVPAFAQSDDRASRSFAALAPALRAPTPGVTRVYLREPSFADSTIALPRNLSFPASFRGLVDTMLERSPTFRRQCLRIAQADGLSVRLVSHADHTGRRSRARTTISRHADGGLAALVSVPPLADVVELIAHELEHIIEQLDGVDLEARAARPGTGVWQSDDGSYETTRAVRVGRAVAREAGAAR